MKNEPQAMHSTGATHIFKCAFENQKHKFASKSALSEHYPYKLRAEQTKKKNPLETKPPKSPYSISSPEIFNISGLSYYTINIVLNI